MRLRFFVPLALLLAGCAGPAVQQAAAPERPPLLGEDPAAAQRYAATITASDLAAHLYTFAADEYEGRETATRGQRLAALYLAAQYRKLGLEPAGTARPADPRSPEAYFQPFPLLETRTTRAELTATRDGAAVAAASAEAGSAFSARGPAGAFEGGVVFAGFGIETEGYSDLQALRDAGLSVDGKWALILDGEPLAADGRSRITADGALSPFSRQWYPKLQQFYQAGVGYPVGFLVVSDWAPGATPMAEQVRLAEGRLGAVRLPGEAASASQVPPMLHVSAAFAEALLGRPLAAVLPPEGATLAPPAVADLGAVTVRAVVEQADREVASANVLAVVPGSDPALRDEYVVVSSHYDHIGVDPLLPGPDRINNGADDDGSGTVTTLELAEAFMQARRDGYGPRRSVLFLNVSGEEKGLLGSEYYADTEPVVPLAKTVTNLNIDMIGRVDPTHPGASEDYVYLIGSKIISQPLDDVNHLANRALGLGLDLHDRFNSRADPNQFYRRSDHWNFGKHNIPFTFYFTGTHEDYHGVGDEPEKIRYERMARIARLIFGVTWEVANRDEPPAVTGEGFN